MACCTESWDCIPTFPGCTCGWFLTFWLNLNEGLWACIPPGPPRTWGGCPMPRRWLAPPGPVDCGCWPGTPLGGTWRMPLARGTCPPPGIPCIPEGRTCCCWACIGCQRGRTCCIWVGKNGRCPACIRTSEYKMLCNVKSLNVKRPLDYFIESAPYRFLFTRRKTLETNELVSFSSFARGE